MNTDGSMHPSTAVANNTTAKELPQQHSQVGDSTSTPSLNLVQTYYDPLHAHASMNSLSQPVTMVDTNESYLSKSTNQLQNQSSLAHPNVQPDPNNIGHAQQAQAIQQRQQQLLCQQLQLHPFLAQQQRHQLQQITPNTAQNTSVNTGLVQGVSTFVTGPSGQQIILGPSAAAALFEPNKVTPARSQNNMYSFPQAPSTGDCNAVSSINGSEQNTSLNKVTNKKNGTQIGVRPDRNFLVSNGNHDASQSKKRKAAVSVLNAESAMPQGLNKKNPNNSLESSSFSNISTLQNKDSYCQSTGQLDKSKVDSLQSSAFNKGRKVSPMETKSRVNNDRKPGDQRRHERNMREQARSHKISQQIKALRDVLSESKVPFKPNKYSILTSVADYIKQLQNHTVFLDGEHKKLLNTITKTTEMVNSGSVPSTSGKGPNDMANVTNDAEMLLVQGLDYRTIFNQCSAALGVVSLDGRFLSCNTEFQNVIGYTRDQLEKHSFFDLVADEDADKFFGRVNEVLNIKTNAENDSDSKAGEKISTKLWSGSISRSQQNFQVNITVTRTTKGIPKFFNCALFEEKSN